MPHSCMHRTPLAHELEDVEWRQLFANELDNVRAAIDWTIVAKTRSANSDYAPRRDRVARAVATPHEALRWFESGPRAGRDDAQRTRSTRDCCALRHRLKIEWSVEPAVPQREKHGDSRASMPRDAARIRMKSHALYGNLGATYGACRRFDEAERAFAQAYGTPELLSRISGQRRCCACGP